jgi:poly(A) polymerase
VLANTDVRLCEDKPVTPAFLFAALLWEPLQENMTQLLKTGLDEAEAMQVAADIVLQNQVKRIALPRRFSIPMREVWMLQKRLMVTSGKRALRLVGHPRFRAAYDFLILRAEDDKELSDVCQWWTQFLEMDEAARAKLISVGNKTKSRRRRTPRKQSFFLEVHEA